MACQSVPYCNRSIKKYGMLPYQSKFVENGFVFGVWKVWSFETNENHYITKCREPQNWHILDIFGCSLKYSLHLSPATKKKVIHRKLVIKYIIFLLFLFNLKQFPLEMLKSVF